MSKKGLKTMLVCIVLLIGLVTLFACNKSDVADKDGQTKVIVKIQDEDGSIYKENVVFSDLFTLSLQKEGYTGRLYRDADFLKPLTKDSKVKNGDTVYVKWTINSYTVTFMDGKTVLKPEKVKHGSAATAPEVPEKDGKTFKGWDKPFDNVTSDLIVNAKWETKKFTLTFINFDGTTVYTEEVEYGASIEDAYNNAVEKVDIEGPFEYDGWYEVGDETTTLLDENNLPEMPARNVTYKLKLKLTLSAIGDNTAITVPGGFTYGEKSATFTVSGDTHDGVNYEYEWTILKDGKEYKKQTTTSGSITIENPDAGTYVASVKVVASKEGCGSVEKDFSAGETLIVSRADISGITVTGVTMTYGDKTAKIGISGLLADDVVTYGTDGTTFPLQNVDLSALNAGEYGYYVRISRGDNYNPYTSGRITVTIKMAEVTATVTPDKDTLTYGDTLPSLTAAINGETYTIESGKYELHLGMTSITGSVANNVGTYNINVDVKKSGLRENYPNYEITVETKGTIKINEAKLTVTVWLDKTELTYGAASPIISYKFEGFKLSDAESDFTITKTKFAEKLDVGTYTDTAPVKVSGDKTNFYKIDVNTVEFKVNKRAATITINKVNDITYGDKVPDLSAKVEVKGVLDGDSLSYTLNPNYEVGNKPGDYTASVEYDENAEANKNYEITATGTKFKVGTKALEIKLDSSVSVGNVAKTYTVEVGSQDLVIGELATGDVIEGSVSITSSEGGTFVDDKAFQKNIVIKNAAGEVVTAYYEITYNLKVVFVKYAFEINADDKTVTYNGAPQNVDLVTWDASKTYKVMYGTAANECNAESLRELNFINAGTYTIYFKVVDTANGAEEKGSVKFTISPAEVTVTVNDVTITYGDTPKFEYTVTGLVEGENLSGEAVYSGEGTDAGDYEISVSGITASDNYKVTFVTGKLTINKKTAEVAWTIAENYVYNDGQTLPTATYDGKTANLKFTKDGKACEFKNAGTYTVTVADNNYILTNNEKTIVIEKATYADPAISLTDIYYDPNKTLGKDYKIEGITWVNPDEVPVCTKTEYAAKYNKDPENYDYLDTTVTLVLQKATVTLAENLFEFNYDGASHEIGTTVRYNNIEVTEPYTLTFEKNMFSDAGTHRTLVTMEADNYDLPKNTYVYVKVKGVKVGNNYYTIEDALFNSKSGDTVEFISTAKEVSFAPLDIATAIYADNAYRTVKAGVTLKLASDEDSSAKIGKPTYGNGVGNYVDTDSSKIKQKLILNESTVLEVYGNILIQGLLGVNGPGLSGHTSGNHSQIINNGTINLNSGVNLDLRGYIKGTGTIEARSGAIVYSPFVVYDYRGGTNTKTVYEKAKIAPFRIYEMPNIQCNYSILYGAEHKGYLDLYASNQHRTDITTIIGNSNAMLIMEDSSSNIIKTYTKIDNGIGMTNLTITGKAKMGTLEITVSGVTVSMTDVRFPMPWNYSINVGDGLNPTTFTLPYDYKMMTGATVNVKKSATVNLTGTLLIYKSFTDTPFGGTVYPNKGEAKLNVEGVVNAIGGIAGEVHGINGGKVIIGNKAILSITEKEGNSGSTKSWQALIGAGEFVTVATISEVAKVVNADNSTVAAETDKTYNYNNGTWQ